MITFLTPSYLYLHKIRVKRALAKYALIYEVPIPDPEDVPQEASEVGSAG